MITPNRRRHRALPVLALAIAGASFGRPAAAADAAIVASLSQPQPGLACIDAAARTSVYFQFAHPTFAVSQISLYLDGKGVPNEAIDQHWPTVTLTQGLHVGRNTVDIVAEGSGGQRLTRRLVVLVGPGAGGDATAPATVPCVDAMAGGEVGGSPPEAIEEPPPVIYQSPPVIVESAPVYVYQPYPVFALDAFVPLVPFFGFSFFYSNYHPYCPPPRVVYRSSFDDRWRGAGRDNGWHGRDGDNDHRSGFGGPRGPDDWHRRDLPNPGAPRGAPYRPVAPAPVWHPPRPVAPNQNGQWHAGDRSRPQGRPNVTYGSATPRQTPPGAHGGGQSGDRGGHRGGERHHDHR